MSIQKILLLGNEELYKRSEEVKQEELGEIRTIIKDLHDTLMDFRKKHKAGRAIAAPQISCFKRLIYMNVDKPLALINPKIEFTNSEMMEVWDDCMCFPELLVKVNRYRNCRIYYKDLNWEENVIDLEGDLSELLQHEYDHLDGILAVQKAIDEKSFKIKSKEVQLSKKIGILGGISHKSTIQYYELILKKYYELKKNYYYPEIVIYSLDFQKFTDFEDNGDSEGYVKYIMEGIHALETAMADVIIMAANSPHSVYDEIKNLTSTPMISIVEAVAEHAIKKEYKKLLLLGIKYTMENGFYQDYFKNIGIEVITPSQNERGIINDIIFKELSIGEFNMVSKEILLNIIRNYKVDAVILGCTELPLIINSDDLDLGVLDTIELHVDKTLKYSLDIN
jgi:peptide deformylase